MKHRVCPWRHAYLFDNPLRRLIHDPKKILEPFVSKGMTVLDIGCGMGFFSIGMAKLIGKEGRVISVDLQQEMLDVLKKRAAKAGVIDQIQTHRSMPNDLGVTTPVDFVLAFWMVHEVPDRVKFLRQVKSLLNVNGHFLVAEPKMHVPEKDFHETIELAKAEGWHYTRDIHIRLSRASILLNPIPEKTQ